MKKLLYLISIAYLISPIILFTLTWFIPEISFIFLIIISIILFKTSINFIQSLKISSIKSIITVVIISLIISLLSGVGGFVEQSGDFIAHNSKYYTLIKYEWPIKNLEITNTYLSYYFGFFIVPAYVSKFYPTLFEPILIIWNFLGISIMVSWLYVHLKGSIIKMILFFGFGGLSQLIIYYINNLGLFKISYLGGLLQNSLFQQLIIVPINLLQLLFVLEFFYFYYKKKLN